MTTLITTPNKDRKPVTFKRSLIEQKKRQRIRLLHKQEIEKAFAKIQTGKFDF